MGVDCSWSAVHVLGYLFSTVHLDWIKCSIQNSLKVTIFIVDNLLSIIQSCASIKFRESYLWVYIRIKLGIVQTGQVYFIMREKCSILETCLEI